MTFTDVLKTVTARFEGSGFAQRPPRYPGVAVEIAPDRVTAVHVTTDRKSKALTIRAVESQELPEGAIEPSITRPNLLAPEPIRAALHAILSRIGAGEQRISVLIPDHVARVALLSFASLPRTRRELTEIVRFRMAKSLPFKPEEAALDVAILPGRGGGPGPRARRSCRSSSIGPSSSNTRPSSPGRGTGRASSACRPSSSTTCSGSTWRRASSPTGTRSS